MGFCVFNQTFVLSRNFQNSILRTDCTNASKGVTNELLSGVERIPIPLTHQTRIASFPTKHSPSIWENACSARTVRACAFPFPACSIAIPLLVLVFLLMSNTAHAVEIGLPLSDPKFNVNVFARQGTKQKQGIYETITLVGGVKIYQGSVSATADEAVLWIDRSLPDNRLIDWLFD